MKSEKEIINQIRSLRDIKPDRHWVGLAKCRIIGAVPTETKRSAFSVFAAALFQYRAAVAAIALFCVGSGAVIATQYALPGQPLYAVKIAAEQGIAIVTGKKDNHSANLQLATKKLEEINLAVQRNLAKDLAAAFYDYKVAKVAAKKEVAALVQQNPAKAGEIVKEAESAIRKIDSREKAVYGVLGLDQDVQTVEGDETASDKVIAESLVNYFKENTTLSEDQKVALAMVKVFCEKGEYGKAVNYYLNSTLNK